MMSFDLHLPRIIVKGVCHTDDATDLDILRVLLADLTEVEHEPKGEYQVDSFVRLTYTVVPAGAIEPVKPKAAAKSARKAKPKAK